MRFRRLLIWGVAIHKNTINEKIDIKFQLFGISEQLKKWSDEVQKII